MATTFRLGDTVRGTYFGVPFVGILSSYDGSGYVYVNFPAPFTEPVVYGIQRDGIGIHPDSEERDSLRLVSRPAEAPAVKLAPFHALGGASLA